VWIRSIASVRLIICFLSFGLNLKINRQLNLFYLANVRFSSSTQPTKPVDRTTLVG
jgi:hypothetical protein